jgi:hypothetical protein
MKTASLVKGYKRVAQVFEDDGYIGNVGRLHGAYLGDCCCAVMSANLPRL